MMCDKGWSSLKVKVRKSNKDIKTPTKIFSYEMNLMWTRLFVEK